MKFNYAVVGDNSVQWFAYLIKYEDGKDFPSEKYEIPSDFDGVENKFINNIYSRPICFGNIKMNIDSHSNVHGWYISENDYKHLKRMIELYPSVKEYSVRCKRIEY